MSIRLTITAAALALATAGTAHAATIDPSDFGSVITENKRTTTIAGDSVRGLDTRTFATSRNGDVGTGRNGFRTSASPDSTLILGKIGSRTDTDQFAFAGVTGMFSLTVNDLVKIRDGSFETQFSVFINGTLANAFSFGGANGVELSDLDLGTYNLDNDILAVRVNRVIGATLYDLTIQSAPASALSPVPLPAGGLLLLTGLAGMAAVRRRTKA